MPPKKKEQPKAGPKVAVDKTFGLKNVAPRNLVGEALLIRRRKTSQRKYSNSFNKSRNSKLQLELARKQRYQPLETLQSN
jgi:hypothetical protein